jgi:hypothetical protein
MCGCGKYVRGTGRFAFAQSKRFVLRERTFLEVVEGTFGLPAATVSHGGAL